ncbi:hypothetical protein HY750_02840, partial [Candidatus Kuenenbacteria bacterium]|nr:hypothetical protein [Candidatus Kuenenbacteria bacterium]
MSNQIQNPNDKKSCQAIKECCRTFIGSATKNVAKGADDFLKISTFFCDTIVICDCFL